MGNPGTDGTFPSFFSSRITTASGRQINGIAVGTTNHNAQSQLMYWGGKEDSGGGDCPLDQPVVSAPTNVTPQILLGGSTGTNVTGQTTSVVVGQQIVLYASYGNVSPTSQSWTIPNAWTDTSQPQATVVGGFNVASDFSTGGPMPVTTTTQQTTTLYWVAAASSQTITFTLNYKDATGTAKLPLPSTLRTRMASLCHGT